MARVEQNYFSIIDYVNSDKFNGSPDQTVNKNTLKKLVCDISKIVEKDLSVFSEDYFDCVNEFLSERKNLFHDFKDSVVSIIYTIEQTQTNDGNIEEYDIEKEINSYIKDNLNNKTSIDYNKLYSTPNINSMEEDESEKIKKSEINIDPVKMIKDVPNINSMEEEVNEIVKKSEINIDPVRMIKDVPTADPKDRTSFTINETLMVEENKRKNSKIILTLSWKNQGASLSKQSVGFSILREEEFI
eukprot:CAMPEP_0170539634 /NCGR_PEP_ID=MMETSP0209-20121228/104069_1 /TAXON_ID=665100 ORGANISM="Litonotus pictus, Strain P1" /NCGR_SAMPLE_ID=MMETSP0209 /ASSEMBLY_ACC=CAM_ASM_000301 /LENGTH=243 /DNA_ID=CAMNT_0010841647 /DNA_START=355 /DNA_END=1087 /DNA_ORIENTATION=-